MRMVVAGLAGYALMLVGMWVLTSGTVTAIVGGLAIGGLAVPVMWVVLAIDIRRKP